jgi:acetyl-CoA carboxylase biotin carboxyl carrier protein
LDLSDLKEILRILEEQDITEFELEQDGVKLRVCRSSTHPNSAQPVAAPLHVVAAALPASASAPAQAAPAAPAPAPAAAAEASAAAAAADGTLVRSPIVGTFYSSPDPNSPPFVSVGDNVRVGQVLCIIEAMKLMNEIEAEMAGEVTKIHPENGQPVQYGDPLFTIRKA